MKIACIQMTSGRDVARNCQDAAAWIARAADQGAELVQLPEYWCLMGQRDTDKLAIAESAGAGPLQDFLREQAALHRIVLVGGTIPLKTANPDKVRNSTLVFGSDGALLARYDKLHLFAFAHGRESYNEGKVQEAGQQAVSFELRAREGHEWRVGLSICYDLRFPELYRQLGADIYLVPSAFTATTGKAHWELLLRARAVENLAFVAAAAQGGLHDNGRATWGQSIIINPWGQVLAQQEQGVGVVLADCDWAVLEQTRQKLPALQHRKL